MSNIIKSVLFVKDRKMSDQTKNKENASSLFMQFILEAKHSGNDKYMLHGFNSKELTHIAQGFEEWLTSDRCRCANRISSVDGENVNNSLQIDLELQDIILKLSSCNPNLNITIYPKYGVLYPVINKEDAEKLLNYLQQQLKLKS